MLPVATPPTAPVRVRSVQAGRSFYIGVALVAILLPIAAFAPSIINQAGRRGSLTPVVLLHAALMASWLGLFFAQTWLAATARLRTHKRLGMASVVIAAGVVVTGYQATVAMARRGYDLSGDLSLRGANALDQTVFQFGALVTFTVLVATALLLRNRPETHKRLMTLAVIQVLMAAPLAHLVGHFDFPVVILPAWGVAVLVALLVHDWRSLGRIHPASLWAGLGLVIVNNVQAAFIGPSEPWRRFVAWLAG